jgi:hypothetical protein
MSTPWSAKEDAILARLWAKQTPCAEIAKALPGRNGRAVQIRASRLMARGDLEQRTYLINGMPKWSSEEDAAIIDGRDRGLSYAGIARDILPERTAHAIEKRAKRLIAQGLLDAQQGNRQPRKIESGPILVAPAPIYRLGDEPVFSAFRDMARDGSAALLRRMLETGKHGIVCPHRYLQARALVGLAA